VEGSVIGEVEPVKIMDTTGELIFGVKGGEGKHNKQTIQKFVGEAKDTLTAFGVEAGFESEDSIAFEEPIEVLECASALMYVVVRGSPKPCAALQ
jgi:hypothetical protein